ncbi:MAG: DUF2306 domain-containing protein [Myxococcota bacterium]
MNQRSVTPATFSNDSLALTTLAITVWGSSLLFGMYILIFYALAMVTDDLPRWNTHLPELHVAGGDVGNSGIGIHFAGGGIMLALGSVQFIEALRRVAPVVHRWLGRIYVIAALVAAVGGLGFIAVRGTVGGLWMDVGFGLYGGLMFVSAVQTARFAMARQLVEHRAWAVRLYALALGSWLYRMDYAFWFLVADGVGHTPTFDGPFDVFMDFAFYLPSLAVAEGFLRAGNQRWTGPVVNALLWVATAYVVVATAYFASELWVPNMIEALS